jgi:hypothetical protein
MHLMGDRSAAGQRPLAPLTKVRILVPQFLSTSLYNPSATGHVFCPPQAAVEKVFFLNPPIQPPSIRQTALKPAIENDNDETQP